VPRKHTRDASGCAVGQEVFVQGGVGGCVSHEKHFLRRGAPKNSALPASGALACLFDFSLVPAMFDPLLPGRGRRMGTAGVGGLALVVTSLALVALVTLKVPLPHLLPLRFVTRAFCEGGEELGGGEGSSLERGASVVLNLHTWTRWRV
jgi:hypothetical protein